MTIDDFLDKWVFDAGMNGGDTRHVRDDLERLIEAVRKEERESYRAVLERIHNGGDGIAGINAAALAGKALGIGGG